MQTTVSPPPSPPELPEQARPRWPWWYGPLGFLAGAISGFITRRASSGRRSGVDDAVGLARRDRRRAPSCWTARWSARRCCSPRSYASRAPGTSGCAARASGRRWAGPRSGSSSFYVFAAVYSAIVASRRRADVAKDLGADQSTFGLIAAGFMIICVAPFARSSSSAASSTGRCARGSRCWSRR